MPAHDFAALRVRALLSDCDGVIVDSEHIADQIMVRTLARAFGTQAVADHLEGLFGLNVSDIIRRVAERLELPLSELRCRQLHVAIDAEVAESAPVMPGTTEVYRQLGLPLAVVSNSEPPRLRRCVERSGLGPLVGEHVYSAPHVGAPKPAPDAYLHAAARLRVPAGSCLVIEDSLTGVRAARAAGIEVIGFVGGSHIQPGHAQALLDAGALGCIQDMHELPALLRGAAGAPPAKGPQA
jgi:HAD superfamily hydrolase (TIGR01509 family)